MNNEQWKADGKCNICRRENYCKSICKAARNRQEYELRCATARAIFREINKPQEENKNADK